MCVKLSRDFPEIRSPDAGIGRWQRLRACDRGGHDDVIEIGELDAQHFDALFASGKGDQELTFVFDGVWVIDRTSADQIGELVEDPTIAPASIRVEAGWFTACGASAPCAIHAIRPADRTRSWIVRNLRLRLARMTKPK